MFKSVAFKASEQGKHILVLGAVHGNETAGSVAQQKIIQQIQEEKIRLKAGSVTFIPIVNELACQQDVRFIDVNLNRVIRSCDNPTTNEEKIAVQLLPYLDACDILLDLHSTHCPQDVPFAFIDYPTPANLEILSLIPVETALAGWPEIYKNNTAIQNDCTEEYIHQRNKIGLTVECGYHKSPTAIDVAEKSILNILAYYGVIEAVQPVKKLPHIITLERFVIKKEVGNLRKPYQHLDKVQKGEVIAVYDNGGQELAPFDGYIIMPNPNATIRSEWFYLGKD